MWKKTNCWGSSWLNMCWLITALLPTTGPNAAPTSLPLSLSPPFSFSFHTLSNMGRSINYWRSLVPVASSPSAVCTELSLMKASGRLLPRPPLLHTCWRSSDEVPHALVEKVFVAFSAHQDIKRPHTSRTTSWSKGSATSKSNKS